jgi:hypothetical protein
VILSNSLPPEAAKQALRKMNTWKYEYQSEFVRRPYEQGKADGGVQIILKQLAKRYGALSDVIEARIRRAGYAELDSIAERVLTAQTVEEAVGIPSA